MNQVDGRGPVANVGARSRSCRQARATSSCSSSACGTVTHADASVATAASSTTRCALALAAAHYPHLHFERELDTWAKNGKAFPDSADVVYRVRRNSAEQWNIQNNSGGWMHPIHIHFEEFRMLTRNGVPIGPGNPESRARTCCARMGS